ncbi:MAG: serine hydrolase [Oscillospiraceae bacterium]|nr:serine hydrolase [Oscillospiraceae bacterium]
MVRKITVKTIVSLILIAATLGFAYLPANASTAFRDIVAKAAILAEADSGQILFAHNIDQRHYADALARVMTLHLAVYAIENGHADIDEYVEMTEAAWVGITSRNTTLNIRPGEIMPLIDLMRAAFISGAAEACNMIAVHISGSVDAFVVDMNARARELGAQSTHFVNAYGMFDAEQVTTAHDQFLIFNTAAGSELFLEIAGVFRMTLPETNRSDARRLLGSNSLLNQNGRYFFRHHKAGMASVSFEGGHSFVGASEMDGLNLVAVILGSDEVVLPDNSVDLRNLSEARRLFEWGYDQFGWRTILATTDLVARASITHGAGHDSVNLRPESEIRLLLDRDLPLDEFVRHITIFYVDDDESFVAPIEAGTVLGEITVIRDGVVYGPIPLLANTGVDLHSFEFIRQQVVDVLTSDVAGYILWGLGILVVLYFVLVIRYNIKRKKRLNRVAEAKHRLAQERKHATEAQYEERRAYYSHNRDTDAHFATDAFHTGATPPAQTSKSSTHERMGERTYPGLGSSKRQDRRPQDNKRPPERRNTRRRDD